MRIAGAQTRPAWLDAAATTGIVTDWIGRAAAADVDLVAFGETFLSGYPAWVSDTGGARFEDPAQKRAYAAYLDAAVELDGPELARITEAVRDLGVFTYLGITERGRVPGGSTVYCTLLAIDPASGIVGAHRKLMPTFEERLVWGTGDGHGLRTHPLPGGWRVGGLNCWENWMPQARHALYADAEHLHVSVWPGTSGNTTETARFIAREGRVFHLAVGALFDVADVPAGFPLYDELRAAEVHRDGGTAIAGPDGRWIVEPVSDREELVIADIDLKTVRAERQSFDVVGHYSRPDVFQVQINRRRQIAATFLD